MVRPLGPILMLAQALAFTADTAAIHRLAGSVSIWQLGAFRAIGGLGLVAVLAIRGGPVWRTVNLPLMVLRAAVTVGYGWVLLWSFATIPFAAATAISFTTAIYIALLAPAMLGEARRYLPVIIGAVGAVLIIKPGFSQLSWIYLAILVGTSLNAFAIIFSRQLQSEGDSAATVLFYVNTALLASFSPAVLEPLPPMSWWLLAACVTGPAGMLAGIAALRFGEASALAPFQYSRLPMAMVGGVLLFGEVPDAVTIVGAVLIVLACWPAAAWRYRWWKEYQNVQ